MSILSNIKRNSLKLGAYCTDIHFGKKSNSPIHNQDCLDYIDWFCNYVKQNKDIDYIAFLGDWNENRSAINISTLNYSFAGASKLNDLNLPIFFVVGNHDLYHRNTRDIHSINLFKHFTNFIVIDQPLIIDQIYDSALFSPYLFHQEYKNLSQYLNIPFWAGHFEFKGFIVTGYTIQMLTGPNPLDFIGPKHIISGHFHKRQLDKNIIYMGNTFPMDYGDADDNDRGLMLFDHVNDDYRFVNWSDCPKYSKISLSQLLYDNVCLPENSRVQCIVDQEITFDEHSELKKIFTAKYNLREFSLQETHHIKEALINTQTKIDWKSTNLTNINDLVLELLSQIDTKNISNDQLIDIYNGLKAE